LSAPYYYGSYYDYPAPVYYSDYPYDQGYPAYSYGGYDPDYYYDRSRRRTRNVVLGVGAALLIGHLLRHR